MAKWLSCIMFGSLLLVWAALSDSSGNGNGEQSYVHTEQSVGTCVSSLCGGQDRMPDIGEGRVETNGLSHVAPPVRLGRPAGGGVAALTGRAGLCLPVGGVQSACRGCASVVYPFAQAKLCYIYALGRMLI